MDARTATAALMLATRLATAAAQGAGDPAAGKALYAARCAACHSLDYNGTGPAHRNLIGRRAGTAGGFAYSAALKASPVVWTAPTLDRWLADPEKFIPGQKMNFSVPDARERADVIAYLLQAAGPPATPLSPTGAKP